MESYDESDAIEHAWRDGLRPDPLLTVSEWADRYRVLSQRASSEPGRWRTARTPYLKEIMDCLSPSSPYQRVAFMKGAQIGGSECGKHFLAFVIHLDDADRQRVMALMHAASRDDRGGNHVRTRGRSCESSHTLWDSCLVEERLGMHPLKTSLQASAGDVPGTVRRQTRHPSSRP